MYYGSKFFSWDFWGDALSATLGGLAGEAGSGAVVGLAGTKGWGTVALKAATKVGMSAGLFYLGNYAQKKGKTVLGAKLKMASVAPPATIAYDVAGELVADIVPDPTPIFDQNAANGTYHATVVSMAGALGGSTARAKIMEFAAKNKPAGTQKPAGSPGGPAAPVTYQTVPISAPAAAPASATKPASGYGGGYVTA